MISIERQAAVPETLNSVAVRNAQAAIRAAATGSKPGGELFKSLWGSDDVRRAVSVMQFRKCGYCERIRDHNRESDVEHFRPKAGVTEVPRHKGYWWLAYEWKNLLFSCRHCNQQYKMNYFPVPDELYRAESESDDLDLERAYLIDPTSEDPEPYFTYDWVSEPDRVWIQPARDDERARITIQILRLNRDDLLVERGTVVETLSAVAATMTVARHRMAQWAIDEARVAIRKLTEPKCTFAGLRRFYFRSVGLGKYIYP